MVAELWGYKYHPVLEARGNFLTEGKLILSHVRPYKLNVSSKLLNFFVSVLYVSDESESHRNKSDINPLIRSKKWWNWTVNLRLYLW